MCCIVCGMKGSVREMYRQFIEEYDIRKLQDARGRCEEVYNYYYSAPKYGGVCARLETIIRKLDELIDIGYRSI